MDHSNSNEERVLLERTPERLVEDHHIDDWGRSHNSNRYYRYIEKWQTVISIDIPRTGYHEVLKDFTEELVYINGSPKVVIFSGWSFKNGQKVYWEEKKYWSNRLQRWKQAYFNYLPGPEPAPAYIPPHRPESVYSPSSPTPIPEPGPSYNQGPEYPGTSSKKTKELPKVREKSQPNLAHTASNATTRKGNLVPVRWPGKKSD